MAGTDPRTNLTIGKPLGPWMVRSTPLLGVHWIGDRFVAPGWHGLCLESPDGLDWRPVSTPTHLSLTACTGGEHPWVVVGAQASILASTGKGTLKEVHRGGDQRGLWAVAYGLGRYLAVGMEGLALGSTDGYAWYPLEPGTNANLWGVAFAQGKFVAVGDHVILVSRDGLHFEHLPAPGILNAVSFANGLWVAVGWGGLVLTSQDGRTWQPQTSGVWRGLFAVEWGNGHWVAVGEHGTVLVSRDGARWQRIPLGGQPFLTGVAWNGQRFVASGWGTSLYFSEDGLTWNPVHTGTGQHLSALSAGPEGFVAVGHEGLLGVILTSPNGSKWNLAARAPGWLMAVTRGQRGFVAVGEKGLVLYSHDGTAWRALPSPTQKWLYGVAFGNNRFVAVGEALLLSQDGLAWEALAAPTDQTLLGVAFGGEIFLAAGEKGTLFASRDGVRWEPVLSGGAPWLKGLASGNGRFVATGYGTILVAKRPWDWEEANTQHLPHYLPSVAYGQGRFALVGHPRPGDGVVAFSEDGLTWEEVYPLATEPEAIAFGQGSWVVAGVCGTLLSILNPR